MIISLNCPSCNENIQINIENNKIVSVSIGTNLETSEEKIKKVLSEKGIEFG